MKYKLTIESDNAEELVALLGGSTRFPVSVEIGETAPVEPVTQATPATTPIPSVDLMPAAPAPTVSASDDELDSAGLPWDERIHASTKAKIADGTWRKRRGVDDETYAAVEAELKANADDLTVATPAPSAAPMPQGDNVPAPQPATTAPVADPQPAPAATPAPPAALPDGPTLATLPDDYVGFAKMVQAGMRTNGPDGMPLINPQYLQSLTQRINDAYAEQGIEIASITDLSQHEFMIGWVAQMVQADGRAAL